MQVSATHRKRRGTSFFKRCLTIFCAALMISIGAGVSAAAENHAAAERDLLYVATPGIRDYLEYGGHGILVFDINSRHKFVKRIPSAGLDEERRPPNLKGIAACAQT